MSYDHFGRFEEFNPDLKCLNSCQVSAMSALCSNIYGNLHNNHERMTYRSL